MPVSNLRHREPCSSKSEVYLQDVFSERLELARVLRKRLVQHPQEDTGIARSDGRLQEGQRSLSALHHPCVYHILSEVGEEGAKGLYNMSQSYICSTPGGQYKAALHHSTAAATAR